MLWGLKVGVWLLDDRAQILKIGHEFSVMCALVSRDVKTVRFYVKFADGSIGAFPPFKPAGQDSEKSCRVTKDKQTGQYHFFPCDPLNELFDAHTPQELASHGTVKFQYRLAAMRIWGPVYCVARTDLDGIRKHKETCYGYH